MFNPQARTSGLAVQELGDESLVYDRATDVAHCLSPIAGRVWRGCNGERDLAALASFACVSEDITVDALEELSKKNLLEQDFVHAAGDTDGLSRRRAIGKIAKYGAGASAIPLIISAVAASPASAMTGAPCSSTVPMENMVSSKDAANAQCGGTETCSCTPQCTGVTGINFECTCLGGTCLA